MLDAVARPGPASPDGARLSARPRTAASVVSQAPARLMLVAGEERGGAGDDADVQSPNGRPDGSDSEQGLHARCREGWGGGRHCV